MQMHPDILDEQERLGKPLASSLIFHGAIVAFFTFYGLFGLGKTEQWGDPNSLAGGAVAITPVNTINLPSHQGQPNPVANNTESRIPAKPKPEKQAEPKPDPNAVKLKSKAELRKLADQFERQHKFISKEAKPNQVYSHSGQALTSPMFQTKAGSGEIGSGTGNPFGTRFGAYEQLLRERVARNWHSQELDSHINTPVVVTFVLMRDGSVQNVKVAQSSGNYTMDQSALRAITISAPFPPLPREFEHNSANLEFWFQLQR